MDGTIESWRFLSSVCSYFRATKHRDLRFIMHRSGTWTKKLNASLWIVLLFLGARGVFGRKCVCTSKACKEAGVEVCRTRFSCYTEEIYDIDGTSRDNSSTRGCTEVATPLLCETNAWTRSSKRGPKLANAGGPANELNVDSPAITSRPEVLWPRLKCCDTHDYCNSDERSGNVERSTKAILDDGNSRARLRSASESRTSTEHRNKIAIEASAAGATMGDRRTGSTGTIAPDFPDRETSYDPVRRRVRPLHVAVVVLAIAALTSVLGACYVVTRFLRSPFEIVTP